jgi:preprotein translocase subunit SecD
MILPSRYLGLAVAFLGTALAAVSCADEPAKVLLEIRRAETTPAEGLTPATVLGRDKTIYLHPKAEVTGSDIAVARITSNNPPVSPVIEFIFTKEGAKKMETLTEKHLNKPIAILMDGRVLSAPVIREKISGRAQITGSYSREDAERLVKSIPAK